MVLGGWFIIGSIDRWVIDSPLVEVGDVGNPSPLFLAEFILVAGWDSPRLSQFIPQYWSL